MRILTASVVAVLGLAGLAYTLLPAPAVATEAAPPAAPASASTTAAPAADEQFPDAFKDRVLGSETAPVTLIEYSALTCPHCADFHKDVLPRIKAEYIDTGKVRMIFREFPFSKQGIRAAMVSRCLPADKFFAFTQALFDTQTTWSDETTGDPVLQQMAGFSGLSSDQFAACVGNERLLQHLLQGRVEATNTLEISSTPTLIIQGALERVVGAQPYETFKAAIDRQLARVAPAAAPAQ